MKKMRKFENGGDIESTQGQNPGIDDDIRARAMDYVERQQNKLVEEPPGSEEDKPKAKPKAKAKSTPKAEPKKETYGNDRRSEKQKAAGEEPSFLKGTKGYNLSDVTRFLRRKAGITSYKSGGSVSSASSRGDGIAQRG